MLLRSQAFIMITFLVTIFLLVVSFYYYRFVKERQLIDQLVIEYGTSRLDPMKLVGTKILERSLVNLQTYCYRCYMNQSLEGCQNYTQICGYARVNGSLNLSNNSAALLEIVQRSKFLEAVLTYLGIYYKQTGCRALYVSLRSLSVGKNPYQGIYYKILLDCLGEQRIKLNLIGVIDEKTLKPYIWEISG